jgi:hypothetical protein
LSNINTKISLFILIIALFSSCNVMKKVPEDKHLLLKNKILVNDKKEESEAVVNKIIQQPNSSILGYKLRLNMFNLARKNPDSTFKEKYIKNPKKYKNQSKLLSKKQVDRMGQSFWYSGLHSFLTRTGEPPVIIDKTKAQKSANRLKIHFIKNGYFNAHAKYEIEYKEKKRGSITYNVTTGKPTFLDTVSHEIESPQLDSLYTTTISKSFLKQGNQYKEIDLDLERERITNNFRNNGVFYFQQQSIFFDVDTTNTNKKAPIKVNIVNQVEKKGDSTATKAYKIYKISEVNIFTNDLATKNNTQIADSISYKNFNLFSTNKLRYKPKAITNAVFIQKGAVFSDYNRALTLRSLSNLRIFNYPNIKFIEDTISKTLKANIYLTAKDRFKFRLDFDLTHSNIQDVGITGLASVSIRNIFRGAEVLEIGYRANIGASRDLANPDNRFFNISETGADVRLSFPRLFLPFRTEKIIPKSMFPSSLISSGYSKQQNIGLDKENFTAALNYSWTPRKSVTSRFDLINIQYVNNININNYFNVYGSSYNRLNQLARLYNTDPLLLDSQGKLTIFEGGADAFINNTLSNNYANLTPLNPDYQTIKSIKERKDRLTENNLIFASSFTYSKDTKFDLFDKQFSIFKFKIESAGNIFSLIANSSKQPKNNDGTRNLFGVQYSQYAKAEFDFIKHWDLLYGNVLAIRSFFGIAIPYGNSKSIPFSRSYFGGGSNDNRAWQSYSLGPGRSGGLNDFNEANMKLAFNLEYRSKLFGEFEGALFIDVGNIWNVLDNETDKTKIFNSIESLKDIAVGSGFGIRYDFKFFIARADMGFKTYNPDEALKKQWFKEYNWSKSVINIGINYPF